MKGMVFILLALFIDGLMGGISWGLAGISTVAGIVTFGVSVPVGILLGVVVDFSIAATLGGGLCFAMWMNDCFVPRIMWPAFLWKLIPFLNNAPAFFPATIASVLKKKAEHGGTLGAAAGVATAVLSPTSGLGKVAGGTADSKQNTAPAAASAVAQRLAPQPANDNQPQEKQGRSTRLPMNDIFRPKKMAAAFLLFVFLGAGSVAHAQSLGSQPDPVRYIVAPELPGPNQLVVLQVEGVGSFLGDASIEWRENGKVSAAGAGQRTFSFTTGGVGVVTRISLTINSSSQGVITHDFIFSPSLVDLLWEADTTTPTLYLGKPLYSAGSSLKVFAFPTVLSAGTAMPASKLSFQWSRKGALDPAQSGLGRDVFSFDGDQIQGSEDVGVDIYFGTVRVAHGEISVPASSPAVLLYARDPLRGEMLDSALPGGISLASKEITLQAEPYYFSNASRRAGLLEYSWKLDGQEVTGPDSTRGLLTLRQAGSGAGGANLAVGVQNTDSSKYVQSASAALQMIFGQSSGSAFSNFFGL